MFIPDGVIEPRFVMVYSCARAKEASNIEQSKKAQSAISLRGAAAYRFILELISWEAAGLLW
jgi:hypothetical protein